MTFTRDFVSCYAARWSRWLAPFKGKPLTALEIGSFEGRSAIWFAENILTHPAARLICVDAFQWGNSRPVFEANIKEAGIADKIQLIHQNSTWLALPPAIRLSWAYIDGLHRGPQVLTDAILVWRSLGKNARLILDDYLYRTKDGHEMKVAIDAFLAVFACQLTIVGIEGNQVCVQKTVPRIAPL